MYGHCKHEQILAELLETDQKFEQIKSIYLLHVYGAIRMTLKLKQMLR